MAGYLLQDAPGRLLPPQDGWYDTGDIVTIDDHGYISICGRAKRFAKIGGEMVSLTAVEGWISALWPEYTHAVIAVEDAKKGEQLVLISNNPEASREAVFAYAKTQGINELSIPRQVQVWEKIPLLATGKVDYVAVKGRLQG
jgi:acyl-[acyl-carrier-protein]-phospholipid O-acyltransferase/long-chain-fatty-acid--[acyl-carrier-protein] ligase